MNVCFLSQYFFPEPGATSEVLTEIAKQLHEPEMKVHAIAGQPSYFGNERVHPILFVDGVEVRRVWSTQLNRMRAFGRIVNSLSFALSTLISVLFTVRSGTVLIAVTNPPLLPWICLAARLLRGHRYVVLVHDVYPDIAVALGALSGAGLLAKAWRLLNRVAYRFCERVVVLGRDMEQAIIKATCTADQHKIHIIPNFADGTLIRPGAKSMHGLGLATDGKDAFVVQYSGNIGRFHEIETILSAAKSLHNEPFLFLFIGEGQQTSAVRRAAKSCVGNIVVAPFQPRENLSRSLLASDVGIVSLKPKLSGLAVPSKLYGILASGRPVLVVAPNDCEAARVVTENDCGIVVEPGKPDELVAALRRLRNDGDLCMRLGANARRAFEQNYDLPIVAAQWKRLIQEMKQDFPAP
jgi:glycosyltransferase involved in cell wall biosynthesis